MELPAKCSATCSHDREVCVKPCTKTNRGPEPRRRAASGPASGRHSGIGGRLVGRHRSVPGLCLVSGADPIGEAPQHLHEDDRHLELILGVKDLFDDGHVDPGGEEHRQNVLAQDGRSVHAGLRVVF